MKKFYLIWIYLLEGIGYELYLGIILRDFNTSGLHGFRIDIFLEHFSPERESRISSYIFEQWVFLKEFFIVVSGLHIYISNLVAIPLWRHLEELLYLILSREDCELLNKRRFASKFAIHKFENSFEFIFELHALNKSIKDLQIDWLRKLSYFIFNKYCQELIVAFLTICLFRFLI